MVRVKYFIISLCRKLDARGRQQLRKDCDEVFPQIIIGTGDCIKDVRIHSRRVYFILLDLSRNTHSLNNLLVSTFVTQIFEGGIAVMSHSPNISRLS